MNLEIHNRCFERPIRNFGDSSPHNISSLAIYFSVLGGAMPLSLK